MLNIIKKYLAKIVEDIDAGNSNISEGDAIKLLEYVREITNKDKRLSKYESCNYLNVSRATFDNYIRDEKLPRGKKEAGFKELSWSKKDLDKFIEEYRSTT